jgi:glutamine amidotransferase
MHADGWGIACYRDLDRLKCLPELVRHKTAAVGNDKFSHQAESTYAKTVLAHVRVATVGYVGTMNSHPFSYDNWAFAHMGTIPKFDQLRTELEDETGRFQNSRCGATDSEQLFLWLLNQLKCHGIDLLNPKLDEVSKVLSQSVGRLASRVDRISSTPAELTFLLTNGRMMFASRFNNPLFRLERQGAQNCEICEAPHVRQIDSADYRAVLFASEPMTDESWVEVPNQTLCSVDHDSLSVSNRMIESLVPHS